MERLVRREIILIHVLGIHYCLYIGVKVRTFAASLYIGRKPLFQAGLFLYIVAIFTVSTLYSPTFDQIYIGYASDLDNRFLSHNQLAIKGHSIPIPSTDNAYTEEFLTKRSVIDKLLFKFWGHLFATSRRCLQKFLYFYLQEPDLNNN